MGPDEAQGEPAAHDPKTTSPLHPRSDFAQALRNERDYLIRCGYFSKAPTLMRLLNFLVEETLAGRGDQLKSYSVAVDGLGRDPDFDAQVDSYPRVQILRLRKLLEAHYARQGSLERPCLYLKSGSYRVRLAPLASAYPELALGQRHIEPQISPDMAEIISPLLEHDLSEGSTAEIIGYRDPYSSPTEFRDGDGSTMGTQRDAIAHQEDGFRGVTDSGKIQHTEQARLINRVWLVILGLGGLLLMLLVVKLYPAPLQVPSSTILAASQDAPLLLLEPVLSASDPGSTAIADDVYAQLADGIGRSWLVRLRLADTDEVTAHNTEPAYRLKVQLSEDSKSYRLLYLRLTDAQTSDLFWSSQVRLKPDVTLADNLGQAIAQLSGPFGVIGARETRKAARSYVRGYSCLLGYIDYLESRDLKVHAALARCLPQELADARLDAVRLALYSFYVLDAENGKQSTQAKWARAFKLARQAVQVDPKESYSHFAMARINFVAGKCAPGKRHSLHAVEANPFDPVQLAILGNFTANCGYVEGEAILDKAYAYRAPGESYARLSLILAAILQKRRDRLETLREDGDDINGTTAAYHHLCETLIAAGLGERDAARASWQKFKQAPHGKRGSDDELLQTVILSPEIRKRVLAFLDRSGVR